MISWRPNRLAFTIIFSSFQELDDIWAALGGDFADLENVIKKPCRNERLVKSVDRVEDKLDSLEECLARRTQENTFAESLLDKLFDDDQASSSSQHDDAVGRTKCYCNYCDLSFPNGFYLSTHMMDRHVTSQKKLYQCFACGEKFSDLHLLQGHVGEHCKTNSCGICEESANNRVNAHAIEEIVRLKLVCDFCSYTDACILSYQVHCLVCTNNPSNNNYEPTSEGRVCPTCLQVFNSNAYMLKHKSQKHSGTTNQEAIVKKFVCDECGRRFISGASLGGHKKIHRKQPGVLPKMQIVKPEQRLNGHVKNGPVRVRPTEAEITVQPKPDVVKLPPVQEHQGTVEDMPDFF